MSTINYDDFTKLDIRIGTILSVDVVEGADRLLKLMVDFGETKAEEDGGEEVSSPRQIVSGIREYFDDPQALVGKQCPFVVNLEPRTIRGLESQGMILAVGDGDVFSLLHPTVKLVSGARIK